MKSILSNRVAGVMMILIITLLFYSVISQRIKIKRLEGRRDTEIIEKYNKLNEEFKSVQAKRDSLKEQLVLWSMERERLTKEVIEIDSLWKEKELYYEEINHDIVRDGTVVDIANFLSDH